MSSWGVEKPPAKVPKAKAPTRTWVRQWGVRYDTGVEVWYSVDLQYGDKTGGGNGTKRQQVVDAADSVVNAAGRAGVTLAYKIVYRDHLTTTWSRWTAVKEEA